MMKTKKIFIGILAIIGIVLTIGCTAPPSKNIESFVEYTDEDSGICFEVPDKWEVESNKWINRTSRLSDFKMYKSIYINGLWTPRATINLYKGSKTGYSFDFENYKENQTNLWKRKGKNYNMLDNDVVNLSGYEATYSKFVSDGADHIIINLYCKNIDTKIWFHAISDPGLNIDQKKDIETMWEVGKSIKCIE